MVRWLSGSVRSLSLSWKQEMEASPAREDVEPQPSPNSSEPTALPSQRPITTASPNELAFFLVLFNTISLTWRSLCVFFEAIRFSHSPNHWHQIQWLYAQQLWVTNLLSFPKISCLLSPSVSNLGSLVPFFALDVFPCFNQVGSRLSLVPEPEPEKAPIRGNGMGHPILIVLPHHQINSAWPPIQCHALWP